MGEYAEYALEQLIWGPSYRYGRTHKRKKTMAKAKSTTQYVDLEGTAQYAMVYVPDEYPRESGNYFWKVNLFMDDANFRKYDSLGLSYKIRKLRTEEDTDDNPDTWTGAQYVTFRRPQFKLMGKKGVYFAPPKVFDRNRKLVVSYTDANGTPITSYDDGDITPILVGEQILIGNGSTVRVNLSTYPTAKGKAARFESIGILDLVEYNPEAKEEVDGFDFGSVKVKGTGLDSGSSDAGKTALEKELNDEIPF